MTAPDTKAIRAKAKMWHLPAGIADDILALCDAYEYSRLAVAHANDHADTAISDMQELRAENERLRAALSECAADFETQPGTAMTCQIDINNEFQRRLNLAVEALAYEQSKDNG